MLNLSDACLVVETRLSIDSGSYYGNWFYLEDYSSLGELLTDCAAWFSDEENPEYVFSDWENIPESMISESWFSPNFFALRDALQSMGEVQRALFFPWCKTYGWDIARDDPHKIVAEFEYAMDGLAAPDGNQYDPEEDGYFDPVYTGMRITCDLFTDNYN